MADSPDSPGDDPKRPASPAPIAAESTGRDPEKALEVFISYNSKDHVLVSELADKLSGFGLKPFLDRWDLPVGQPFRPEIEHALASCNAVVVAIGPHGLGNVQDREVDVALQRQGQDKTFPVIPVLLPGSEPPQGFLAQLNWIDLRYRSVSDGARELAEEVRGKRSPAEKRQQTKTNRARYLRNLLWLLLILVVGAIWYFRHLHSGLTQVAFGGSITLIVALRLVYDYFKWGAEEEVKNLPKRVFGGPYSSYWLIGALILVVGLLVVTSSVQLESSSGQSDDAPWKVEVLSAQGTNLWTSPEMPRVTTASRLFFFRFGEPIRLRLVPERGHAEIARNLGLGSRILARVPSDFPPRALRVLRVLPGPRLINLLAQPNQTSVSQKYELRLGASGQSLSIRDLRRQAVYLAPQLEDIELGLARETESLRRDQFGAAARRLNLGPATSATQTIWNQVRRVEGWTPPASLDALSVELITEGTGQTNQLTKTVLDGTTDNLQTILIEKAP